MAALERSVKLEKCEVCDENKARYTCPKCEVRTCCLKCVNIHKKELECDGIRDRTKFIPLKSFTDYDILSDYRLLEEAGMLVDKLKRNPIEPYNTRLPKFLSKLKEAANRRKVNLKMMPDKFTRRKENTTRFMWKTNKLFWRIEWIFPQAENLKYVSERVLDTCRLSTVLEDIWNSAQNLEKNCPTEELHLTLKLCDRLQYYKSADICGVIILLKAERVLDASNKFYELDPTLTIRENLENKTIIEFPTIYVTLKDHKDMFNIIDPDECTEKPENVQCNTNIKDEPVNFFFNTELSESESEEL